MKQFGVILAAMLFAISTAFADGTKQLMPNQHYNNDEVTPEPQGQCYITIAAQEGGTGPSRPFARYNSDGTSCPKEHRIHIHIVNPDNEMIYFGFGKQMDNSGLKFRIKDPDGVVVYPQADVPSTEGPGFIKNYSSAYYGPNTLTKNQSPKRGYNPLSYKPTKTGDYWIEFYNGHNIGSGSKPITLQYFDVTVAKDTSDEKVAIDGRVWSKAWGLDTRGTGETNAAYATFYTRSNDNYTSKVYLAGVRPQKFVFGCNHYGARNDPGLTVDEKRQSYMNANTFVPEYKVFLTRPNDKEWGGAAHVPNIPENLTFAGSAMSCEDLIFAIKLFYTEDVTLELFMDLDPEKEGYERVVSDLLEAHVLEDRGLHYPWKNNANWTTAGEHWYLPDAAGCARRYKLSLFDQSYTYEGKKYNPGDTIPVDVPADDFFESIGTYTVGTATNPILIKTKQDLVNIAEALQAGATGIFSYTIDDFYVNKDGEKSSHTFDISAANGFSGIHFYLIAPSESITLDDEWVGIGAFDNPFKGTFRCGNYIPNPINEPNDDGSAGSSTIEEAGAQNTIVFDNAKVGLFYNCENAIIDNIHVKGTINSAENDELGSICNMMKNSVVRHCTSQTNILSETFFNVGGIVGMADGSCVIDSCANYGNIIANSIDAGNGACGGIVGTMNGDSGAKINFCRNTGTIRSTQGGGIVGVATAIEIYACKNEGYIEANGDVSRLDDDDAFIPSGFAGGIAGFNNSSNILFCQNTGTIYSKKESAAGICNWKYATGGLWDYGIMESCLNKGVINGVESVGLAQQTTTNITYSLSSSPFELYTNTSSTSTSDWSTYTSFSQVIEDFDNYESNGFIFDDNGNFTIDELTCCGNIYRIEDAGRLFNDDETFYITWDGKDDNGNCVVGDVTVAYQKNSGVTHFPFYDPEIIDNSSQNYNLQGMVVYRISPIQDEILNFDPEKNDGKSVEDVFGYQALPKNYYHIDPDAPTSISEDIARGAKDSDEMGIELKLFWDDTQITKSGNCEQTGLYGTNEGKTTITRKCVKYNRWGQCSQYGNVETITYDCRGIENVSSNGYYGSGYGGHIFPAVNFGDKNTMNTWWNGIERKANKTLKLYENEPAILMPVELDKWTATNLKESVLLEWTTASEENNDYFAIERSIDGVTWKVLGNVGGAGTTSATHYYSFEDTKPVSGISYYRLKQVDFNGEYTYSSIKCINRPANADKMYKAYVNKDIDAFIVQGEEIAACNIEVYNNLGVKMTNLSFNPISTDKVVINVGQLPVGTYFIKICNGSKSVVKSW